jgi:large subunit ribosomal protein L6
MSRIGKQPIVVPPEVKVEWNPPLIKLRGPKGELSLKISPGIKIEIQDNNLVLKRENHDRETRSLHGLYRALIFNMVKGVTEGYQKRLEVMGVGYRAELKGKDIQLLLGLSHPVLYKVPDEVDISVDRNFITIQGIDKQKVGQVAAEIRSLKPPEPYKGKGIRYADEPIKRKAGKATVGGGGP